MKVPKLRMYRLALLTVLLAIIIGSTGCSTAITQHTTSIESKLHDIKTQLNRNDIYGVTVSGDKEYVAYIQGDPITLEGQLFIWKVSNNISKPVEGVNNQISKLFWSPNSKYLIVDSGTSIERGGRIVDVAENVVIENIVYYGIPFWSPDSNWIAIGMITNINATNATNATELNGAIDLVLYNIQTKENKIIANATKEYYYLPTKWDIDWNIHYNKNYYNEKPTENLVYSIKSK